MALKPEFTSLILCVTPFTPSYAFVPLTLILNCTSKAMFNQVLLLVPALIFIGAATGADAHLSCAPFSTPEHVTHANVVTVTTRVTSYYPDGVDNKDVTFTQTQISWVTSTMTVDETHVLPPHFVTSTYFLVSTSFHSTIHTMQAPSTTTLTTSVLLTTLTVITSTVTHSSVASSLPKSPKFTTTTTLYTTPIITHTYVKHSTVPPQVSTITSFVTVTVDPIVATKLPPPKTVTTTTYQTVTFCDEPHTRFLYSSEDTASKGI